MRAFPLTLLAFFCGSFTLLQAQSPGNVNTGLSVWLKANAGTEEAPGDPAETGDALTLWLDQSGNGRNYTVVAGPTLQNNTLNFNPSVQIMAGGFDAPASAALTPAWSVFFVSRKLASDNNGRVFEGHSGNNLWAHWGNYRNSIYIEANPSNYNSGIAITSGIENLHLHSYVRETVTNSIEARADGSSLATFAATNSASGIRIDINAGAFSASESSHSRIGEMIIYNSALTAAEVIRVESYLALKYGLTIAHNYIASDGTSMIWDLAAAPTFNNNIAGIGRDNASGLDQRMSTTINSSTNMIVDKGGAFPSDLSFVAWGDNNLTGSSAAVAIGYTFRSNRIWRTDVTGTPGAVNVSVDLNAMGMPVLANAAQYSLISSADTDFTTGFTSLGSGTSIVGNVLTFTGVTLNDAEHISVALTNAVNPANISPGLVLWLKANGSVLEGVADPAESGDAVTTWEDASGLGNHYVAVAGPTLQSGALNNNPALEILSGGFDAPAGAALTTTWTTFFVSKKLASDPNGRLFDGHVSNYLWAHWDVYRNSLFLNNTPANHNVGIATTAGIQNLHLHTYKREASGSLEARADGTVLTTFGTSNSASGVRIDINQGAHSGETSDSQVGEMIVYNSPLTTDEINRIESYLGIKYGLTLDHNYLTSDATLIWDATANATYHNDVTGIGRDDVTALDQRQSSSVNTTGSLSITKSGAFTTDKDFLVIGTTTATGTSTNLPAGYSLRSNKTWYSQVTGSPGAIAVSVSLTAIGLANSGNAADYTLLIDTDTDFSTGATAHTAGVSLVGNTLSFTGVNLSNGSYFAFAVSNLQQPGGVLGTQFWVKGDVGVTGTTDVSRWADQNGLGNDAFQNTVANQPGLLTGNMNGHSVIEFSGTSDIFQMTNPPANLNSTIFTVAATNNNSGYRTMFRGTTNDHPILMNSGTTTLGYFDGDNVGFKSSGFTLTPNEIALVSLEMYTSDVNFRKNGTQGGSINNINLGGLNLAYFGNYQGNGQPFGRIAETIIYNSPTPLTTTEKEKIESYLAIKYGITLSHNYLASDATVLWNVTTNAGYNNFVTAINRDDASAQDQRVSTSVHTGAAVTISRTGAFGTDKDALIIGSDLATGTSTNVPSPYFVRSSRIWKTATRGTPGAVGVSVNLQSIGFPVTTNGSDYALLIDSDTDFSSGATPHTTGASIVGNVISFTGVPLTDGAFFTVAAVNIPVPGGIAGNVFWVIGDVGVTGTTNISNWADQSGLNNNAFQATPANQPSLLTSNINFHNTVQFTGNQIFTITTPPTNVNSTIFTVAAPTVNSAWRTMFRGNANDHQIIVESGNTRLGYYDNDVAFTPSGFTWLQNEVALVSTDFRTGDVSFRKNGTQGATLTTINHTNINLNNFGNYQGGGQPFGRIAETIIYNNATPLTTTEKERVETYLASKYGITLTHNYIATDNVVFWNVTTNAAYNNNVTVIGRDDNSGLDQRTSLSQHTNAAVTMTKSGAFGANLTFLAFGNNTSSGTSTNIPSGFVARTARIWKTALQGTPGTIDVSINLVAAGLPVTGNAADYALLIDGDTDFSTGAAQHTAGAALVGNTLSFTGVNLLDGQFFAIAAANISLPGGIAGNVLWVKGDVGVTGTTNVTSWADQGGTANDLTMANAANQPSLIAANINSHASLNFTNTDVMQLSTPPTALNSTAFVVGAPLINTTWRTLFRNPTANDWTFLVEAGNTRVGYYDVDNGNFKPGGFTWLQDEVAVLGVEYQTGNVNFRKNGAQGTGNATIGLAGNITYIGGLESGAQAFGRIAEAIVFNTSTPLTSAEKERIESYLAVKYGITLTHNYVASDGTVTWNVTTNATYNNNITGIGRDDVSSLDQRSSLSVHAGAAVTITKPGAFSTNNDNLLIGNDTGVGTSLNTPAGFDARATRIWKTALRGTPGAINISFNLPAAGLTVSGVVSDYSLLIDSDTDFSTGATEHTTGASLVGNVLSFTGVNFADGQFFTVASRNVPLPGGVAGNVLWVKGDVGVTGTTDVSNWADQGGTDNHLAQGNVALQPALVSSNINTHASINFAGSDAMLMTTPPAILNTTTFVVGAPMSNGNWRTLMRTSANDWPMIVQQGGTGIGYYDADNVGYKASGFTWLQDEVALVSAEYLTSNVNFRKNGTQGTSNTTINLASANLNYVGGYESGAQAFGRIGEALIFKTTTPLTTAEKERIESYLAVKYGITLTHNYVSSDGVVVWNTTTNSGYGNNITGIGRDDQSLLDQQTSQGVHSGNTLSLNKGGAFSNDFDYLLAGSTTAIGIVANVPSGYVGRTNRTWKTALRGTPGAISMSIDISAAGFINTGNASDYALLIDTDTDFSSGATIHTTGVSLIGNILSFTGVTFANNNFFALATSNAVLPGGVGSAVFWVRADAGVTGTTDVSSWADQSLNNNHANQGTVANQPGLVTNAINANPVIDFTNANDVFLLNAGPANLNSTVFTVASPAVNTAYRTMFRGTASDHPLIINTGTNNLGYYDNDVNQFKAGGFTWAQNEVAVVALEMRTGDVNFRKNGSQGTSNATIVLTGVNLNYFGNFQGGGQRFGRIAETIIYNTGSALTTAEKNMIESYLAVKYGITLAHDYVATNGTVTWSIAANATYHNNVTGIGRDDVTVLDQRTSLSVHTGATVTMEKTGAFGASRTFLMWGNNTGTMSAAGVTDFPASEGVVARLARVWKVATTGTPGAVNVRVDLSTVPGSKSASDLRLIIDRNLNGLFSDETVAGGGIISGATLVTGSTFQFAGVTFNNNELFSIGSANIATPLPITLSKFEGHQNANAIDLNWTTNAELNNDFFAIERSTDGVEFVSIATIKGAGTTSTKHDYYFTDAAPFIGDNYYRLKQTDFDKKFSYSGVVHVKFIGTTKLYPNPTSGTITVEGEDLENALVSVMNSIGMRATVSLKLESKKLTVDLKGVSPGVYFLKINRNGNSETLKFVVQ